jgi:transposase
MPTHKINQIDFSDQPFYIGLDVHKKSWNVTVRTSGLEVENFGVMDKIVGVYFYTLRFRICCYCIFVLSTQILWVSNP